MGLFPRVPVTTSGGQVVRFGKESFVAYSLKRSPGAATKRVDFGYLGEPFALEEDAIEFKVPFEWQQDASQIPGINLATRAINIGMKNVALSLEIEQAALALNPNNYDTNHKTALTGTDKWSSTGDPIAQIAAYREAVRASIGQYTNVVLFSAQAWNAFRTNAKVRAQFQYTNPNTITLDQAKGLLECDAVYVGKAITADPDTGAFSDVWGNNAILAYVPQAASGLEEPSFGYTYTMEGHPLAEVPYQDRNQKSWIYPATYQRVPVLTGMLAGYLIQTPA
jgi:hypothetical protein